MKRQGSRSARSFLQLELPSPSTILDRLGAPKTVEEIGLSEDILPLIFKATKDIRDKYVLSRLYWDLGVFFD